MVHKMKHKSFFILLMLVALPLISALPQMKPAELNQPYNIVQTCQNATYVNVTVTNKDGILLENQALVYNGSANWIYPVTNTQVGRHDVTGSCDVNGVDTPFVTYYEVTGNGLTDTIGYYFLIIVLSIGLISLGIYTKDATITILGTLGLYFFGLYVLFYGIGGIKDSVYTWGTGIITLGCAAYISIRAAYEGYLS